MRISRRINNIVLIILTLFIIYLFFSAYVPVHYICHDENGRADVFTLTKKWDYLIGLKSGYIFSIDKDVHGNMSVYGYTYEEHQEECFRG